jgi:hypothetical protein
LAQRPDRITAKQAARLSLAAGFWAALVVFAVQLAFGKTLVASLAIATPLAVCTLFAALVVAPWFWRRSEQTLASALPAAGVALTATYLLFGLFNVIKDIALRIPSPLSSLQALPVFVAFSLPIALPATLVFAWASNRILRRERQAIDAPA